MNTKNPLLEIAGILALFGAFTAMIYPWAGIAMIVLGLGLLAFMFWKSKKKKPAVSKSNARSNVSIQRISSEYEVQEPVNEIVTEYARPLDLPQADRTEVGILLGALRSGGINTNVPIVEGGTRTITVRDIVVETARISREKGKAAADVAPRMPAIYESMWKYAAQACERHPQDAVKMINYIASSALNDVPETKFGRDVDPAACI